MGRISLGLLALVLCELAHGQSAVYSSGSPNQSAIWYADVVNPPSVMAAAEFTLNSAAAVNQLSWWGGFTQLNAASANDSFQMNIYSGNGGTVGSLIASVNLGNSGEATNGKLIQSSPEYAYNASFASIALGSGTYFLALQRSGGTGPAIWGWETSNPTAQSLEAYQSSSGTWAYNTGVSLAFLLGGTLAPVPEASTSWMCLLGLLAIGFVSARSRAS